MSWELWYSSLLRPCRVCSKSRTDVPKPLAIDFHSHPGILLKHHFQFFLGGAQPFCSFGCPGKPEAPNPAPRSPGRGLCHTSAGATCAGTPTEVLFQLRIMQECI